ncbi:hypothetical protein K466DRAFT_155892 [Polyporus arcularius HHB13444]|uniref:Uncharacterized protein n=1 Tax=Polyporus arcularius HHB13444 TaxID=1314778 RepID=A0A5C3PDQ4_9APHY|nr:hypothetical protein K466DRAFT_155892 [Polyporus arcularius HHB13444]
MEREKERYTGRNLSGLNRDAVSGTSLASLSSATIIDRRPSVPPWHTLLLAVRSDQKFTTFGLHLRSSEDKWEAKGEADEFIRRHAGKETETLLKRFSNLRAVVFTLPTWDAMDLQSYRRAIVDSMPQMAGVLVVRESRYEEAEISVFKRHVNDLPISVLEKWYTSPGQ